MLINGRANIGIKKIKNPKANVYSQTINDVYENLEDYNPIKKSRVLIVFDDIIADMEYNKKLSTIVTESFLRRKKLYILHFFILQHDSKVPQTIRLNVTHYFIMKIPNKRELQQIALNHLSDIDFKDFTKLYKDYTKEPYSFLANDQKQRPEVFCKERCS